MTWTLKLDGLLRVLRRRILEGDATLAIDMLDSVEDVLRKLLPASATSAGDQLDAMLAGEEKLIAAFCPECGGWTMFCTSTSENARQWIRHSYVAGDLIMVLRTPAGMGPACPTSWEAGGRCEE